MSLTTGVISTSISSPTSSTTITIITPSSSNSVPGEHKLLLAKNMHLHYIVVTSMSEVTQSSSTLLISSIPSNSSMSFIFYIIRMYFLNSGTGRLSSSYSVHWYRSWCSSDCHCYTNNIHYCWLSDLA